jgi:putative ATP-binding cassette transporter
VIILDDALSALEEPAQAMLLATLRAELPESTIVSLGQRQGHGGLHDRQLVLERGTEGAALKPIGAPALAGAK